MAITWNPDDKHANFILSNGNLTATGDDSVVSRVVRATEARSTGKLYFEFTVDFHPSPKQAFIGVGSSAVPLDSNIGGEPEAWSVKTQPPGAIHNNGGTAGLTGRIGETFTGDIVGVAVDLDNGKIWFSRNGTWGDLGNPSDGTNPPFSNVTGELYPIYNEVYDGALTANFGATPFVYDIPTGFRAFNDRCVFTEANLSSRVRVLLEDKQGLLWTDTQVANELKIAVEDLSSRGLCVETVSDITTSSGTVDYAAPTDATSIVACVHYDRHKSPEITWNPNDKHPTVYLASSNLLAGRFTNSQPTWATVRETQGVSSGKVYAEFTYTFIRRGAAGSSTLVGVMHDTADLSLYIGSAPSNGWGYRDDGIYWENGSSSNAPPSFVQGDIIMIALDMDDSKIWWGKNGVWNNSGDPETGANAAFSNLSGTVYCAFSGRRRSVPEVKSELTANFGASDFTYDVPSGFLPYDADLRDRGLQRIDPMMVSHLPFGVTGPPQYWYYYNGRIGIYPVPDAAYTINVYHAKVTEDLTDIPCFMRPLLVWHVVARLRGSEGWEDDKALFKKMYDNSLDFAKDQFFIPEVDSIMDQING